ncbi:lyase family protein [Jannaschia seohaensis]|uniref:3-carboxy-cis,cis-muconate cycloisomerase n=1 Tax=Jannaschia seohaensis TaxID=475081 RepID=A0A2Y9A7Z6_9RHOB|nr:lyase family protein [Jannaschia seohaensis]PWJ22029.1 3-carboxy-cis,cis-muconate cycloisomerase [Jannaschia seohaensis]SSA38307.1 3-carboxy-cis,cis-muconate cycloisomerase [Jannaschia seohaensis]
MTVSPFDSAITRELFSDREVALLFSDTATVRAILIFWGAVARAQGEAGIIPETAGAFLHRATMELQVDPSALAERTAQNGIMIPGLVAETRKAAQAPEYAQYLHWGLTSQDALDSGLALRLRQALTLIEARLDGALERLADLAEAHAETPMAARTWGQVATPTSFGAAVAVWGEGLLALRAELEAVRDAVLILTLHGASGTLSALGPEGPALRVAVAKALGLRLPPGPPHAERSGVLRLAGWANRLLQACAKPAADLLLMTRDGSVVLAGGGASSTMPQKANPVAPSTICALAAHGGGLAAAIHAQPTRDARDGAAWLTEWLSLPPLIVAAAKATALLRDLEVRPDPARLRARLDDPSGLIHAEALSFAMARDMPRPEAQARIKGWVAEIRDGGGSLLDRAGADPAEYAPERHWGDAPAQARAFAARVRDGI